MLRWFQRLVFLLFPVNGWRKTLREYRAGKRAWDNPYDKEGSKLTPWPAAWVPYQSKFDREEKTIKIEFIPVTCMESGRLAPVGEACCCARCGLEMHLETAHRLHSFEPPFCRLCRRFSIIIGLE